MWRRVEALLIPSFFSYWIQKVQRAAVRGEVHAALKRGLTGNSTDCA